MTTKHELYLAMCKPGVETDAKVLRPLLRNAFDVAARAIEQQQSKDTVAALTSSFWDEMFDRNADQLLKQLNKLVEKNFTTVVLDALNEKEIDAMFQLAKGMRFDDGPAMQQTSERVATLRKSLNIAADAANVVRTLVPQMKKQADDACKDFDPDEDLDDK